MQIFTRRLPPDPSAAVAGELRLTFDWRQKSRCRVRLAGGQEVGLDLPRGAVLREGDLVGADDGALVRVRAATEQLLQVRARDALELARIAYHLGNRHVPVQVGADEVPMPATDTPDAPHRGWLRLQLDHVLEHMVEGLGGRIEVVSAPFDPESGAYGHSHGHSHPHPADAATAPGGADGRHAPRIHDFVGDGR